MVLFPEIDRVKTFLSLTACIVEYVSEYIFLIKKNRQRKQEDQKKKQIQRSYRQYRLRT